MTRYTSVAEMIVETATKEQLTHIVQSGMDARYQQRENDMNKVAGVQAGWQTPQLQMQLTPLAWGLEIGFSNQHFGVRVGPLAVMVWFRFTSPFTRDCVVKK